MRILVLRNLFFTVSCLMVLNCKSVEKLPDPLKAGWKGKKVCEVVEENKSARIIKMYVSSKCRTLEALS